MKHDESKKTKDGKLPPVKQYHATDVFQERRLKKSLSGETLPHNAVYYIVPVLVLIFVGGALFGGCVRGCGGAGKKPEKATETKSAKAQKETLPRAPDLTRPVREAPEKFARDAYLPKVRETEASGAIVPSQFSPGRDLIYVDDPRVWWESDHDGETDDECDHSMHRAMEIPFRRLVNLVEATGRWQLKVQECYRATGIHAGKSLHKEGRALDITVDRKPPLEKLTDFEKRAAYEELAKLAWQAGFDWVLYEYNRGTGPHVHASVRVDAPVMTPAPGK